MLQTLIRCRRVALGMLIAPVVMAQAQAALPPKYQRLRELQAILESSAITGAFPDRELIGKVEYLRPDVYRVSSLRCRMDVTIQETPNAPMMVGPRQFVVNPGALLCRK